MCIGAKILSYGYVIHGYASRNKLLYRSQIQWRYAKCIAVPPRLISYGYHIGCDLIWFYCQMTWSGAYNYVIHILFNSKLDALKVKLRIYGDNSNFNTLRPRQQKRHFADDTFKYIFFNECVWIVIKLHGSLFLGSQLTIFKHWFR